MIYKFKSKAAGDVIMMGPAGDEVLRTIGKAPGAQGIIEAAAMPAAIGALEAAVAADEAARAQAEQDAAAAGTRLAPREGVTWRQRAWPLVEMMKRSAAAGADIVWGFEKMKLWSDGWVNGEPIPSRHAAGRTDGDGVAFAANVSPHLAWGEVPAGTRSFALVCHDFDVPSRGDDVNQADREVPADLPRVDFFHWVMVDLPAGVGELAEGAFGRGFVARGKPGPALAFPDLPPGLDAARHGLNDYTGWFATDPERAGRYFGYDGPFPPFNDSLIHHYVFTVYALDVARAPVEGDFTGAEVRRAIFPHVLAEATLSGTYTLNRRLLGR